MMLVDGLDQGSSACRNTFISATKLASFEPVAIQAVTGAGAPSYASGAHWWNGTAATLNPKPTSISRTAVAPATLPASPLELAATAGQDPSAWIASNWVVPVRP